MDTPLHVANDFPDVALRLKEFKYIASTSRNNRCLRAQIQADMNYLEDALHKLKTIHNSCVDLLRISPEILSKIVDYLVLA
ncbi:unnamed protein product [Peniophora sp. CBMAI 1063]|nr:unnamed protein product [Peniophora sp. CBMAI 1063]